MHATSRTQRTQFFDWMLARASNDRPCLAEGHAPCAVFNQLVRSRAQLLGAVVSKTDDQEKPSEHVVMKSATTD